jgi:hypothetical protein
VLRFGRSCHRGRRAGLVEVEPHAGPKAPGVGIRPLVRPTGVAEDARPLGRPSGCPICHRAQGRSAARNRVDDVEINLAIRQAGATLVSFTENYRRDTIGDADASVVTRESCEVRILDPRDLKDRIDAARIQVELQLRRRGWDHTSPWR